ncbi:hypothetical protein [Candidatus Blastococcus massiliensis]|uniref:hypothetical protein n=1 Tax=Candidatus Blastococcus massiliensis TaxID=1470358 RepID=UPI0012DD6EE5|nr:hypothetical protein [Candidatus Blastococcus massiliensis]
MESRAAVFTSSPQAVEVYQAGAWWSGELLGWRHDASGACEVWVRVVVGGVEESAWTDLADLRLPERHLAVAPRLGAADSRVQQELPTGQAVAVLRGTSRSGDASQTAALPMIRDMAPAAGRASGSVRSGGRRRAPEDGDIQLVSAATVPVPAGRHRAPDDEGRHRAADTGVVGRADEFRLASVDTQAVPEPRRPVRPAGGGWSAPSAPSARPSRAEESIGRSEVCGGRGDAEPDLLTRPMRLSDHVPHARRPRLDGSLSGV